MSEPSARELIEYFRGKALEYERLAKNIEQAANEWPGKAAATTRSAVLATLTSAPAGDPTLEKICGFLRKKGARAADLAQHFGTADSVIRDIVTAPDSGLIIGDRGWIKFRDQAEKHLQNGNLGRTP